MWIKCPAQPLPLTAGPLPLCRRGQAIAISTPRLALQGLKGQAVSHVPSMYPRGTDHASLGSRPHSAGSCAQQFRALALRPISRAGAPITRHTQLHYAYRQISRLIQIFFSPIQLDTVTVLTRELKLID